VIEEREGAEDRTIEEIQRSFARFKDDIDLGADGVARSHRGLRARGQGASLEADAEARRASKT